MLRVSLGIGLGFARRSKNGHVAAQGGKGFWGILHGDPLDCFPFLNSPPTPTPKEGGTITCTFDPMSVALNFESVSRTFHEF